MQKKDDSKKKSNEFLGFSLFNEIKDNKLRAYNRCVIVANLTEDNRKEIGMGYMNSLDEDGQKELFIMAHYIQGKGFEDTLKEIKGANT